MKLKSIIKTKSMAANTLNNVNIIYMIIILFIALAALVFFITGCSLKEDDSDPRFEETGHSAAIEIADAGNTDNNNDKNIDFETPPIEDDKIYDIAEDTSKSGSANETGSQSNQAQDTNESKNDPGKKTSGDDSGAGLDVASEGEEIKITSAPPGINLHIIMGPEFAQDNQICFYRVMADVSGQPFPLIRFSKDDSNGAWGPNIAQVNLTVDESFTLKCEATNSMGTVSSEINLVWVENPVNLAADGQDVQLQPEVAVDYADFANFLVDVNLTTQQVTVLYKDAVIKSMVCSSGKAETPTPSGIFTTYQKIYYAWIPKFAQGAYYWTRFYGPYLFHSVPYDSNGNMMMEELDKIGAPASHGCVRLMLEDAKWFYETLPLGMQVNIHN